MPIKDPTERSLTAKVRAHESWAATEDRTARTRPGNAALWQSFLDRVDGDPVRARHLWKAHFARLALKSAQARRRAREQTEAAAAAEAELEALGGEEPVT